VSIDSEIKPRSWRQHAGQFLEWFLAAPLLCWGLALAIAIPVLYAEENWRGKRAWNRCRQRLEAKGIPLDWSSHLPPKVAPDENAFAVPGMSEWFGGRGPNQLTSRMNLASCPGVSQQRETNLVIEFFPALPGFQATDTDADLVLEHDPPDLRVAPESSVTARMDSNLIPLIVMDQVPLTAAIRNLARHANLSYVLDPAITYGQPGPNGQAQPEPEVSFRWENVTAKQALRALLCHYNLRWIDQPKTRIARIVIKDLNHPRLVVDPALRSRFERLVEDAVGPALNGSQGIALCLRPPGQIKPSRVAINVGSTMGTSELMALISRRGPNFEGSILNSLAIEKTTNRCFRAVFRPSTYCTAADYLAWSDRFEPDFDQMRAALGRPYAILPGDYQDPMAMPTLNFVTIRTVAQTLAQRAQCQLLLGHPDQALRELTLIHNLGRMLESRPATLVSAMIEVALAGLYSSVIADGFRLRAWQAPQLAALQAQTAEVNLCAPLAQVLRDEPALTCRIFENATPLQLSQLCGVGPGRAGLLQRAKDPLFLILSFAPRGWVYHNMVSATGLWNRLGDGMDETGRFLIPHTIDQANKEVQASLNHFSPRTVLASIAIPNFAKAWQTVAFNQVQVNEASLACALERYRLAQGSYPASLDMLIPEFAHTLPVDTVLGGPLHYLQDSEGSYRLYSVGWNEADDGGQPGRGDSWAYNRNDGDWVWQIPPN
jgi:hypothetical protein